MLKPASGKPIITMTTEVAKTHASIIQGPGEVLPAEDHQVVGSGQSQGEACELCKGKHGISRCLVFPTKS